MKKILFVIAALLILVSCSKKEDIKLEAFNPEAFAYDLGESWEVNSSVRVKGFKQTVDEKSGNYSCFLFYTVELADSSGNELGRMFEKDFKDSNNEKIMDVALEAQFEIDNSISEGTYIIVYTIIDKNSKEEIKASVNFELSR